METNEVYGTIRERWQLTQHLKCQDWENFLIEFCSTKKRILEWFCKNEILSILNEEEGNSEDSHEMDAEVIPGIVGFIW